MEITKTKVANKIKFFEQINNKKQQNEEELNIFKINAEIRLCKKERNQNSLQIIK